MSHCSLFMVRARCRVCKKKSKAESQCRRQEGKPGESVDREKRRSEVQKTVGETRKVGGRGKRRKL